MKNGDELDGGVPVVRVTRATPVFPPGVTDDTPDFKRDEVMLDIPDQLFGNSFTMVTNISKIFGDLLMVSDLHFYYLEKCYYLVTNQFIFLSFQNTARRYSQFVQYFKPVLGKALTIKGLYPPPPTTTTPFSFPDEESSTTSSSSTTTTSTTESTFEEDTTTESNTV